MDHETASPASPASPTNPGRHRHDRGQTWTPEIPGQAHSGTRGAHESDATSGRLAGELPTTPELPPQRSASAELGPPRRTPSSSTDSGSGPTPERTRVSFTEPNPPDEPEGHTATVASIPEAEEEQDTHANGLRMFDLGSVPASVTPPRSWRRAAWFAAASSGGVMGLLFAGTFLFGQQPAQPQATGEWTYLNRHDGAPLLEHYERSEWTNRETAPSLPGTPGTKPQESEPATSSNSTASTSSGPSGSADKRASAAAPGKSASTETSESPHPGDGSGSAGTTSPKPGPTTTRVPQKPPPSPAETTVVNERYTLAAAQRDVQEMARLSEDYLNTVTENPQQARQYTTGELRAEGADGLRQRYSRIAYFEVRTITVNQGEGVTVNTVRTVYKDGRTETQQRRLVFGDNGKISHADQ